MTPPASKREKFFKYSMGINSNETSINSSSSTLYCPYAPYITTWGNDDSVFYLIIGLITVVASFPTVLLNAFIILAIKQRRELQKSSNIMLSSLAVTDLLVGAILMPTCAIIDFFRVCQVSFQYTCPLHAVNMFFGPLLFSATFHHLTIIAWERYVAAQKWMDYKRIITNGRLKKIAIGTWLSAVFPAVASFSTTVVITGDSTILDGVATVWTAVDTICLFLVAFFYRKVYLGIRSRKLNEISQIDVLMKAKMEAKVAKTTGLLTAAVISSFIPIFAFAILVKVVPIFDEIATHRFTQTLVQLNSLINPLLYCYRDRRFRNAVCELLGRRRPQAKQLAVGAAQCVVRSDPFRSSKLHIRENGSQRLKRSASCNLTGALDSIHGAPCVATMKRSLSAPALDTCGGSLDG